MMFGNGTVFEIFYKMQFGIARRWYVNDIYFSDDYNNTNFNVKLLWGVGIGFFTKGKGGLGCKCPINTR